MKPFIKFNVYQNKFNDNKFKKDCECLLKSLKLNVIHLPTHVCTSDLKVSISTIYRFTGSLLNRLVLILKPHIPFSIGYHSVWEISKGTNFIHEERHHVWVYVWSWVKYVRSFPFRHYMVNVFLFYFVQLINFLNIIHSQVLKQER